MLASGKGMFIWYRSITSNGDIDAICQHAKQLGLSHVQIKIADGIDYYKSVRDRWTDAVIDPLIEALYGMGIQVWVWQYIYLYNPVDEARYVAKRIKQHASRLTGFIIDAEMECKFNRANTEPYMRTLRNELPRFPIGLSSYRFPRIHPELNWLEFAKHIDMWWPQVYWEQAHNPTAQLIRSVSELREIANLPIVPTGSAYSWNNWEPSITDLDAFNIAVKSLSLRGLSWWYWTTVVRRPDWFSTIANHDWPTPNEKPEVPPEEPVSKRIFRVVPISGLKLRSQPSLQGARLLAIPYNSKIQVTEIQERSNETWVQTDWNGVPGWACWKQVLSGKQYTYLMEEI